ncbi:hypothetical protein BOTBODRAFT_173276 [Botryobasidium botryosum FD-172 SS1]|uniref:Uncharacterized protein n=1 Tax=Botryobasidium botryosum (strain FD-172 SS1) TaxID=930990 RepID=A0A067MKX5_BOTB1|nr:hypothetical protein BOTBODRAFT_173276 [Botryobasidium botryosum FD-172 SS1]
MSASRYISHSARPPSDLKVLKRDLHEALVVNARRVHRHPNSKPRVYVGATGLVVMDWRLAALDSAYLPPKDLLRSALATLKATLSFSFSSPRSGSKASFLETSTGPATLILLAQLRHVVEHAERESGSAVSPGVESEAPFEKAWETCARILQHSINITSMGDPGLPSEDGCEVLYGRAGLLYALLLLRARFDVAQARLADLTDGEITTEDAEVFVAVRHLISDETIADVVDDIVKRGKIGAEEYAKGSGSKESAPELMWAWHGKRYLGAAHGMLVSCPTDVIAPHIEPILRTAEWLMEVQNPNGNWPTKAGPNHVGRPHGGEFDDELVQWCHGAPGVVILFSTILQRAEDFNLSSSFADAFQNSLRRGAELTYQRGILRKGVGLCHGVGGNVYALLRAADALGESPPRHNSPASVDWASFFGKAVHLACVATKYDRMVEDGEMTLADAPYSLYEGLAGMCCAWTEVLQRLEGRGSGGGMPGYDDLEFDN